MLATSATYAGTLKTVSVNIDTPYPPVRVTSYVISEPRMIRVWTARIDLSSPDVELVMTCPGAVEGEFETECATTSEFAEAQDLQIAINASPFAPYRDKSGEGMDIVGFGACDGKVYSPSHEDFGALVTLMDGSIDIWSPPFSAEQLAKVDDAIGGFRVLVRDGKDVSAEAIAKWSEKFADVNPRTAVGLADDGKTLWLIIADGRNKGHSEGMTLAELAEFALLLGCDTLLNFDGGGSSSLVVQDPKTGDRRLLNKPMGMKIIGTERLVGNHLGVRIRPTAAKQPDAS